MAAQPSPVALVTPSVSLTDDSGSDDAEGRRRELSPSPEVDLTPPDFDDIEDDVMALSTSTGSLSSQQMRISRDSRHDSPPLEKDEREFTQTADVLLKRKLSQELPVPEFNDRGSNAEYGYRDEFWFGDSRSTSASAFLTSPAMKPTIALVGRKDDDVDGWTKYSKLFEWDQGAESIEIDELDCLLDTY